LGEEWKRESAAAATRRACSHIKILRATPKKLIIGWGELEVDASVVAAGGRFLASALFWFVFLNLLGG